VLQLRGDTAAVIDHANAAIGLCVEHEFVHYLAMASILRGWAIACQGDFEKGIAEIQDGLEKERTTGALLFESYSLGLLADACLRNKRYGQSLDFLKQAQQRLDEEASERYYAAEIYRLFGEAYLRSTQNLDQAEQYFCKALEIARKQQAKSFELRAGLSMHDLYEMRESADKYHSRLARIYGCFGEGFDTPDLVRAKAKLKNARFA
jgi:predicted ATPase